QVLIVHTHGSEAYTPDAVDRYEASDIYRTEDERYNVIRVGDELARELEKYGLTVHHDRNIYDYPSYTGSYTRSGEAVSAHLAAHPETAIVIDLHRDALGTDDIVYKTVATLEGESSSQLMFVVGTDESGLAHPGWEDNLALALRLQQAVVARYPTLARPILLVRERYNQHLTPGSLILEVGSSGNSLQEALSAVRLFAAAVGPVMEGMLVR
ncbi:MAG: stage II sporulation protein P, partial [Eubacteriales bacterium]|nr:stage II sporulation protein P [Eubacteriales bacterium]